MRPSQLEVPPDIPAVLRGMETLHTLEDTTPLDSTNTCIGASSVLDLSTRQSSRRINALLRTMQGSPTWTDQNSDKYEAGRITVHRHEDKVTAVIQAPDKPSVRPQITIDTNSLNEALGGGAFNAMMDAAIIKATIKKMYGLPQVPADTLTFSAPQRIRQSVLEQIERAGVKNIRLNGLEGEIRQTFVITGDKEGQRVMFTTLQGSVKPNQTPDCNPDAGYWLFNNEVGNQVFDDTLKTLRSHPELDKRIIWAVGSNQLKQDPNNFDRFLGKCNTVILNLDEAVDWILRHSDPEFSSDQALLSLLDETPLSPKESEDLEKGIARILEGFRKIAQVIKRDPDTQEPHQYRKLMVPFEGEKRIRVAQRVADLIHSMGVEIGTVFITDGGFPTISSRKYKKSSGEVQKKQLYIPVLTETEVRKIKAMVLNHTGSEAQEYTIGCGDSVAGTILALKQLTNDDVLPSTITIVSNYISCLLRWMPYPNLLEIQARYPDLVKEVLTIALTELDKKDLSAFNHHQLDPIPEALKGRKPSLFGAQLKASLVR